MPKRPYKDLEVLFEARGATDRKAKLALLASMKWKVGLRDEDHEIWKGPQGELVTIPVKQPRSPKQSTPRLSNRHIVDVDSPQSEAADPEAEPDEEFEP